MASYARDVLNFKYYKAMENKIVAEQHLIKEKEKSSNKIHYIIFASKEYPGKFILSYLPKSKVHHEFITIRPEGFRFRQQSFDSLNLLFKWFKEHYRDPVPSGTPSATPAVQNLRTPYTTPGYHGNSAHFH
jgi:transcription elongation factor SPT6